VYLVVAYDTALAGAAVLAAGGTAAYAISNNSGGNSSNNSEGGGGITKVLEQVSRTVEASNSGAGKVAGAFGSIGEGINRDPLELIVNEGKSRVEQVKDNIDVPEPEIPEIQGPKVDLGQLDPNLGGGAGNQDGVAGPGTGADIGRDIGRGLAGLPIGTLEGAWNAGGAAAERAGTPEAFQAIEDGGARFARNLDKVITGDAPKGDTIREMRQNVKEKTKRQNQASQIASMSSSEFNKQAKSVLQSGGGGSSGGSSSSSSSSSLSMGGGGGSSNVSKSASKAKDKAKKAADKAKKTAKKAKSKSNSKNKSNPVNNAVSDAQDAVNDVASAVDDTIGGLF